MATYAQIDVVADALKARGIRLDGAYRRRDAAEPGRTRKEELEDRLAKAIRRLFLQQQANVLAMVEAVGREGLVFSLATLQLLNEAAQAAILMVLHQAGKHGVELFAQQATIGLDLTAYNVVVDEQLRSSIGTMITGINATTLEQVRKAVQFYVETPGMTLGDLAKMLPFDERRAQMVARTEITQIYGQINKAAAEKLAAEHPDVEVEETWHTNKDDLVCPVCGGLDGVTRRPGQPFIHKVTGAEYQSSKDSHPECRCWTTVRTRIAKADQ